MWLPKSGHLPQPSGVIGVNWSLYKAFKRAFTTTKYMWWICPLFFYGLLKAYTFSFSSFLNEESKAAAHH